LAHTSANAKAPATDLSRRLLSSLRLPALWLPALWLPALLLPALLLAAIPAQAHGDGDQDRARAAVQAGKVLPLKTVLERLAREQPGQVLEVELDEEDGRWLYEIKLLQGDGRRLRLEIDAATGELLRSRERTGRSRGRH
jgi:hypothetical protein